MAVAGLAPISKSPPLSVRHYHVTGLTASSSNAITLTGVDVDFTPDPEVTRVYPVGGAAIASASYNAASLVKNTDPTKVDVTVYCGADTTAVIISLA